MLVEEVGLRRERAVHLLVAWRGAEQVAVQACHELAQRGPAGGVEPRLAHVLGGGLGRVELERLVAIQVQQHRDEAVREGCGVPARARTSAPARRTESAGIPWATSVRTSVRRSPTAGPVPGGRTPRDEPAGRNTSA